MNKDVRRRLLNPYQREVLDRVPAGRDHWGMACGRPGSTRRDFYLLNIRKIGQHRLNGSKPLAAPSGTPIVAEVRDNRWIAQCECMGAEVVDPDDPVFFCWSCFNASNQGLPRPVIFPDTNKRRAIERVLTVRPDPLTRGWHPTETIEDLERENRKHGLPVRRGG